MADQELAEARDSNAQSGIAETRLAKARAIREQVVETLPKLAAAPENDFVKAGWWFSVTMAEALFGLGHYPEASEWLHAAKQLPDVPEWEFESTSRQLACLARLKGIAYLPGDSDPRSPWTVLRSFLESSDGVVTAFAGKVGLALSGGGFRASFFHIGVLAKLDVLRHLDVLSCVSGGSIIGAHYYLELKNLLQSKSEREIRRQDYIDLVEKVQRDFPAGVECNIRTRESVGEHPHAPVPERLSN